MIRVTRITEKVRARHRLCDLLARTSTRSGTCAAARTAPQSATDQPEPVIVEAGTG